MEHEHRIIGFSNVKAGILGSRFGPPKWPILSLSSSKPQNSQDPDFVQNGQIRPWSDPSIRGVRDLRDLRDPDFGPRQDEPLKSDSGTPEFRPCDSTWFLGNTHKLCISQILLLRNPSPYEKGVLRTVTKPLCSVSPQHNHLLTMLRWTPRQGGWSDAPDQLLVIRSSCRISGLRWLERIASSVRSGISG